VVISYFLMEDFKERASAYPTHKPMCWFHYADDTFAIWPHKIEKLQNFLDHLNVIHRNIQFMEMERDGNLPFLDIHIYRRPDDSLGHKVY